MMRSIIRSGSISAPIAIGCLENHNFKTKHVIRIKQSERDEIVVWASEYLKDKNSKEKLDSLRHQMCSLVFSNGGALFAELLAVTIPLSYNKFEELTTHIDIV